MKEELIAPCGMNCAICSGYLAFLNDVRSKGIKMPYCMGCRPRDKKCSFLKKRCQLLLSGKIKYCYQCKDYPCTNLEHIDNRYRTSYKMSMIENLEYIKKYGVGKLLKSEEKKWKCSGCGEVICCHNGICFNCEMEILKNKGNKYRWEDN